MPYSFNDDGSLTVSGADPTAATDSAPAIQAAIDWLSTNYGGGKLWLPRPGSYKVSSTLVLKGGVELLGHSRELTSITVDHDIGVLNFDASCRYAAVRDIFLTGFTSASSGSNAVSVAVGVPVNISRCKIWGGSSALWNRGIDGTIENCFISGWGLASILSNGANWYKRVKADTSGQPCQNGFYQGTPLPGLGVMENHFEQCDFSGQYTNSVYIGDGGTQTAYSAFSLCVFSAPIRMIGAKHTAFDNCAIGSPTFQLSSGTCNIVGSYGYSAMSVPGASKAGNTNIS
jgi:hypothetical protein